MKLIRPCYSCLAFFVGVVSLLAIKAEINYTKNYTETQTHNSNAGATQVKYSNSSLTTANKKSTPVLPSKINTIFKALLGNKAALTTSGIKDGAFFSNTSISTTRSKAFSKVSTRTTGGMILTAPVTSGAPPRTQTSNSKSPAANSNDCKETHRDTLMICIIIIAVLVLVSTFLLIATVGLANRVSYLKKALHSKRQTRNNGDFLTISSSLWPSGSDKWKNSQLLSGPSVSMENLSIEVATSAKSQGSKDGSTELIKKMNRKSKTEPESTTLTRGQENSMEQALGEDLKSSGEGSCVNKVKGNFRTS